jgi:hypothetical protein
MVLRVDTWWVGGRSLQTSEINSIHLSKCFMSIRTLNQLNGFFFFFFFFLFNFVFIILEFLGPSWMHWFWVQGLGEQEKAHLFEGVEETGESQYWIFCFKHTAYRWQPIQGVAKPCNITTACLLKVLEFTMILVFHLFIL